MKMKMKTIVTGGLILVGTFLIGHVPAEAAITGTCSECHTMHNSQNGVSMTSPTGAGAPETDAQEFLLLFDCLQCHTRETDGLDWNSAQAAPAVNHTGDPLAGGGNYLAGGSFYYVENAGFDDEYGHNVDMLTNDTDDTILNGTAPGDTLDGDGGFQLSCVGNAGSLTSGCHVGGGHHSNQGSDVNTPAEEVVWVDGTSVGDSFRFLSGSVQGGEHYKWEFDNTDKNSHNVYKSSGTYNAVTGNSITAMCANCHGDFHGKQDGGDLGVSGPQSPWIRHPTDLSLLGASVNAEHAAYGSYSVQVPIGTDNDFGLSNADMTGSMAGNYSSLNSGTLEFVLCQSCHRAHGSQHLDMLRFTYANMEAGTTTAGIAGSGCFKCHTQKDG